MAGRGRIVLMTGVLLLLALWFSHHRSHSASAGGVAAPLANDTTPWFGCTSAQPVDVAASDYFHDWVKYTCQKSAFTIQSGNTFNPWNNANRGQVARAIVKLETHWVLHNPASPSFGDVPTTHPDYVYIETLVQRGSISGYDGNGSTVNPCTGLTEQLGRRYYRPCNPVTRGQVAKIVALAEKWAGNCAGISQTFTDVPPSDPFFCVIHKNHDRRLVTGYADGSFHPYESVTRSQIAKIGYFMEQGNLRHSSPYPGSNNWFYSTSSYMEPRGFLSARQIPSNGDFEFSVTDLQWDQAATNWIFAQTAYVRLGARSSLASNVNDCGHASVVGYSANFAGQNPNPLITHGCFDFATNLNYIRFDLVSWQVNDPRFFFRVSYNNGTVERSQVHVKSLQGSNYSDDMRKACFYGTEVSFPNYQDNCTQ